MPARSFLETNPQPTKAAANGGLLKGCRATAFRSHHSPIPPPVFAQPYGKCIFHANGTDRRMARTENYGFVLVLLPYA
jgi:hypothetical protein